MPLPFKYISQIALGKLILNQGDKVKVTVFHCKLDLAYNFLFIFKGSECFRTKTKHLIYESSDSYKWNKYPYLLANKTACLYNFIGLITWEFNH